MTSAELADGAGLNERYVREWLGAMVTGGVVELDPAAGRYRLPPEHAAWLTRAASPNNIAVTAQYVALLGQVEDDIVRVLPARAAACPYERFGRFHEVMAEESDQTTIAGLLDAHPAARARPDRTAGAGIACSTSGAAAAARCSASRSVPAQHASSGTTSARRRSAGRDAQARGGRGSQRHASRPAT